MYKCERMSRYIFAVLTKRPFYVIKHFLANRRGCVRLMKINKGEELLYTGILDNSK
jgi:hypothetical protein